MSKGLKIFLAVSVLLNVLLVGILIGTLSHTFMGRMEFGKRAFFFHKELPPEKRELVLGTMKKLRSETKETRKELKRKRDEIIDVFTAPEFDVKKFDQEVAEMHAIVGKLADELAQATKKIAAGLDQEERKALGEAMRRSPGPPFLNPLMDGPPGTVEFHGERFHEERFDGPPPPPPPPPLDWEEPLDGPVGVPHE